MKSSRAKRVLWVVPVAIIGLVAGLLGAGAINTFLTTPPVGTESESRNTQVIDAVTRTEQVALLSLGIQGIAEKTARTTIFGMDVPGSDRALFLMYTFNAKLGLDGKDVRIKQTGDSGFEILVPKFIFIGHDNMEFRLAAENNGVLSWATPEIDTVEMTNSILNDAAQQEYIDSNEEILRDQARAFYAGIITGIDPTIELDFEFDSRQ